MPSASASDQAHVEKSCVLLFISVDLVGSTAFKNERSSGSEDGKRSPAWVDVFKEFYAGFPRVFERNLDGDKLNAKLRPKLVKTIGDEILLQTEIRSSQDARRLIKFLGRALVHYKATDLSDVPLLPTGQPKPHWLFESAKNACLTQLRSEIWTMRSSSSRTAMNAIIGWFSAMAWNHGTLTVPALHEVVLIASPDSPFGQVPV